jgi:hypothetical protein
MFKLYAFFLLLSSLCLHSADFECANRFLDSYPLTASDGRHGLLEKNDVDLWAGSNGRIVSQNFGSSMFAFSALQVLRGTKAVSFLTPQVFYNGVLYDLSKFPIWQQLLSEIAKTKNIKVFRYESSIPIIYEMDNGKSMTKIQAVPSFIFVNTSLPNWQVIMKYLGDNKRNSMVHPKDDVNFILEGYLMGYSLENIETFYNRMDAERKIPFQEAHAEALQRLIGFGLEVESLKSEPNKFAVEFEEVAKFEEIINPCAFCKTPGASKICSRCRKVRYCKKECQENDWKSHKNECSKKS